MLDCLARSCQNDSSKQPNHYGDEAIHEKNVSKLHHWKSASIVVDLLFHIYAPHTLGSSSALANAAVSSVTLSPLAP